MSGKHVKVVLPSKSREVVRLPADAGALRTLATAAAAATQVAEIATTANVA